MKASSQTFNGLIKNHVKEKVSRFNSYCMAAIEKKSEESLSLMRDNHWYLKIDPELGINTRRLISILLSGDVFTGYMHSQQFYSTFTFDLEEGKELKLRHLFKKNIKYLDILSSYCIDWLSAKLHPIESKPDYKVYYLRSIENGASAKEENYRYFYLTPESIVIVFPPYQIASYAAGTHKVYVPYSFLKDSLSPEYFPIEKNQQPFP